MGTIYETDLLLRTHFGSMHPGGLRLTDRAVRLAGLTEGMRAADIGCGIGATAAFLAEQYGLSVVGLEISDKLINKALKSRPSLSLIRWDGKSLPFEENSLDAVFFECTLSLLKDARAVLVQAATALKKTGTAIISDIYAKNHISPPPFTFDGLAETLAAAGYDIIVQEDHTAALRTYAAELWNKHNAGLSAGGTHRASVLDTGSFLGMSCQSEHIRLSGLGYMLTIARKI
ncbi:MAG: class I SAM-dependent methyltransferase [Clostridiales bacterium]|nr:class I SAM-dependent methyltransferase [Clostridiales bacterium]